MSYGSSEKLVELLQESLPVQKDMAALQGGAILPELCVYVTLGYLVGGPYTDILVPPLFIERNSHSYNRTNFVFARATVPY